MVDDDVRVHIPDDPIRDNEREQRGGGFSDAQRDASLISRLEELSRALGDLLDARGALVGNDDAELRLLGASARAGETADIARSAVNDLAVEVSISEAVETASGIMRGRFPGVRIERFVEGKAGRIASGPLGAALLAGLTNACEAAARVKGGVVRIEVSVVAESVSIDIADNGMGIPAGIPLSSLFRPLAPGGAPGRGFGLSMCAEIVEGLGGVIGITAPGEREDGWTVLRMRAPVFHLGEVSGGSGEHAA